MLVRVPYTCPAVIGIAGPCPGVPPHDCEDLRSVYEVAEEQEARGHPIHTATLLLFLSVQLRERDDWPEALTVASGYPYRLVKRYVEAMIRNGIFGGETGPPAAWMKHPVALTVDAMMMVGILERMPPADDGEPCFRVRPHRGPYRDGTARMDMPTWQSMHGIVRKVPRCQEALSTGSQCQHRARVGMFCRRHTGGTALEYTIVEENAPATRRGRPATRGLLGADGRAATGAERYRLLREAGRCAKCETAPAVPGKTRCAACTSYGLASTMAKATRRQADGKCPQCGGPCAVGAWRCPGCKARRCVVLDAVGE